MNNEKIRVYDLGVLVREIGSCQHVDCGEVDCDDGQTDCDCDCDCGDYD